MTFMEQKQRAQAIKRTATTSQIALFRGLGIALQQKNPPVARSHGLRDGGVSRPVHLQRATALTWKPNCMKNVFWTMEKRAAEPAK